MNNVTLVNLIVLWTAIAAVVGGSALVALRLARENRRLREGLEEANDRSRAIKTRAIEERRAERVRRDALEKHCVRLDGKLLALEARQHRVEQQTGGSRPYELAMQMAGRGAGIEELVATGLSRGEAELALHMHGLTVS